MCYEVEDLICCTAAGMAELASAYPSTGGQYHFAFMVSPPKSRAFIAFVMGWLSVLAWVLTTTSAAIFCGKFENTGYMSHSISVLASYTLDVRWFVPIETICYALSLETPD